MPAPTVVLTIILEFERPFQAVSETTCSCCGGRAEVQVCVHESRIHRVCLRASKGMKDALVILISSWSGLCDGRSWAYNPAGPICASSGDGRHQVHRCASFVVDPDARPLHPTL